MCVLTPLDAATGKETWRNATSMYGRLDDQPLLLDPNLLLVADYPPGKYGTADETGFLYRALDRATGSPAWESQTSWKYQESVAFQGLLFVSDHKIHQVLNENNDTSPDSWISAVNLITGKAIWGSGTVKLGIFTPPAAGEGKDVVSSENSMTSDAPDGDK